MESIILTCEFNQIYIDGFLVSKHHKDELRCIKKLLEKSLGAVNGNRNTIALHIKNKKPYLGYLWA